MDGEGQISLKQFEEEIYLRKLQIISVKKRIHIAERMFRQRGCQSSQEVLLKRTCPTLRVCMWHVPVMTLLANTWMKFSMGGLALLKKYILFSFSERKGEE